jgi:NAD(P)-dependent dehydrogenase (short-subunit alcohol dehydrogenase family)
MGADSQVNHRTVLITGASSGFGRLLVPAFLDAGWAVIATLRGTARRAELFDAERRAAPDRFTLLELDVTSGRDRAAAAEEIERSFGGRLDCLVNNAGSGLFGALEDLSEAQLRAQMEVNFFGLAFTTRALLPHLRAARGRVINISSVLGFTAMPLTGAYTASKFAVDGLSEALYFELQPHGVQVAVVQPGAFRTDFAQNQQYGERVFDPASPYYAVSQTFARFRERRAATASAPPDEVVKTVLDLATRRRMPLRVRCGRDARSVYALKRLLPQGAAAALMSAFFRRTFGSGK